MYRKRKRKRKKEFIVHSFLIIIIYLYYFMKIQRAFLPHLSSLESENYSCVLPILDVHVCDSCYIQAHVYTCMRELLYSICQESRVSGI